MLVILLSFCPNADGSLNNISEGTPQYTYSLLLSFHIQL